MSTTDIVPVEHGTELEAPPPPMGDTGLTVFGLMELVPQFANLANELARTNFVPTVYRNKPAELTACWLAGAEVGLLPMTAMRQIYIVEGRPTFAAEMMRSVILARGHDIWVEDESNHKVTLCGRRRGWPSDRVTRVTWTIDDAKVAGLDRKANWRAYPRDMLTARATGRLCRLIFADLLAGLTLTREEAEDGWFGDDDAELVAGEVGAPSDAGEPPAPAKRTRKASARKSPAKKAAAAPPEGPPPATPKPDLPESSEATAPPQEPQDEPPAPTPPELPNGPEEATTAEPEQTPEQVLKDHGLLTEEEAEAMARPPRKAKPAAPPADEAPVDMDAERQKRRTAAAIMKLSDLGIDSSAADDRHAFLEWMTDGATSSARDITSHDLDLLDAVAGRIRSGALVLARDEDGRLIVVDAEDVIDEPTADDVEEPAPDSLDDEVGEGELVDDDDDDDGPPTSAESWRGFIKGAGLRVPDALRQAAAIAANLGVEPPTNLEALVAGDPAVAVALAGWVEGSRS